MSASAILDALACGRGSCACATSVRRGSGRTHCPAHPDVRDPSLNVSDKDGTTLVHCHAACEQDRVLAALRERGLWGDGGDGTRPPRPPRPPAPPASPPPGRRIVATYRYEDEEGTHLFDVLRYEPKTFVQRRADGAWTMAGVRLVPYRLPEVLAAIKRGKRIYIVEGEKDADALTALGLTATTSPAGAGKWRDDFAEYFEGAEVVVIADRDEPGRRHAREVAESVWMAAKSVRVVEMEASGKDVKDVSDFLATYDGPTEHIQVLEAIVAEAPEWKSAHARRIMTAPELAYAYGEVLDKRAKGDPEHVGVPCGFRSLDRHMAYRAGDMWLIVARTGTGKSAFVGSLWDMLAERGEPFMLATVEQPWVQWMDRYAAVETRIEAEHLRHPDLFEPVEREVMTERLARFAKYGARVSLVDDPSLTTKELAIYARIAKVKYGVRVVFVDYLQRLGDPGRDEYERVSAISNALVTIARELRICVVGVAQVRKGTKDDGTPPDIDSIRDSGKIAQDASIVLSLGRKRGGGATRVLVAKNRHGLQDQEYAFHFDTLRMRFEEAA